MVSLYLAFTSAAACQPFTLHSHTPLSQRQPFGGGVGRGGGGGVSFVKNRDKSTLVYPQARGKYNPEKDKKGTSWRRIFIRVVGGAAGGGGGRTRWSRVVMWSTCHTQPPPLLAGCPHHQIYVFVAMMAESVGTNRTRESPVPIVPPCFRL